jgi:DNA-binding response OmpR family regulator
MNILVAEDDKMLSKMMCSVLKEGGHICVPVFDAMQAVMYAIKQPPDLVLLDINMPGGTGLGVLRKLKASSKTSFVPILVISGSIDPAMPAQVLELGAAKFLSKPLEPDVLLQAVLDAVK